VLKEMLAIDSGTGHKRYVTFGLIVNAYVQNFDIFLNSSLERYLIVCLYIVSLTPKNSEHAESSAVNCKKLTHRIYLQAIASR